MKKVILFDFDDTLCMTEELCFHAENKIVADMGHPPMTRAAHQSNWGSKLEHAITTRVPGINVQEFMGRFRTLILENIALGDEISAEVLKTLDLLKAKGHRLGILTARNQLEMTNVLKKNHPLASRMEYMYHLDNCPYHKPDSRVFEPALRDYGIKPQQAVYIGDSLGDAIAAKGAGMTFVATLESGIRTPESFKGLDVDFFINELEELSEMEF